MLLDEGNLITKFRCKITYFISLVIYEKDVFAKIFLSFFQIDNDNE